MENGESLFLEIIGKLNTGDVLPHIVLVGSWVLPIYREYFDDDPEIPILRTNDVDFLIGMPPNIHGSFDVPAALSELGFEPQWSLQGDFCKYVHPEIEVEFLIPELGRGRANAVKITELGISAQPLRFLSLAYKQSISVPYHGYKIRVPEPEAFVLLKLLILPRRKDEAKRTKDASRKPSATVDEKYNYLSKGESKWKVSWIKTTSFGFELHITRGEEKMALNLTIAFSVMCAVDLGRARENNPKLIPSLMKPAA